MVELDFESDEKLKALTEALRAGPGSPQWRQAVSQWRASDAGGGGGGLAESEHQLLMRVREHLASGKSYREIRPGAGFTRRVMEGIDEVEAKRAAKSPGAGWIAGISGLVIVAVVAAVTFFVWPRGEDPAAAPARLDRTYFVTTVESATFEDSISPQWQTFGNVTLMADRGLRPAPQSPSSAGKDFTGGGVYWDRPLGAEQAFSMESAIELARSTKDVVVQLFVTDERSFQPKSATTPHELVWTLSDGEGSVVLPDGSVVGALVRLDEGAAGDAGRGKQTVDVRIVVNQRQGLVEVNRQKVWSGPHQLDPSKPRAIGVRFLTRGEGSSPRVTVRSIRLMQP